VNAPSIGWRGRWPEEHLTLEPEEDNLVQAAHSIAEKRRPDLDRAMLNVKAGAAEHGGQLVGLDHSLKSVDSFRSKVARRDKVEISAAESVGKTRDLNRYTFTYPHEQYTAGVEATYEHLDEQGFAPIPGTHKNYWNDPAYQGINTSWRHKETGQPLEVQFHTPESFAAKEANHTYYELDRVGFVDTAERREATRHLQNERYADVVKPTGVEQIREPGTNRVLEPLPSEPLTPVSETVKDRVRADAAELAERKQAEHMRAEREAGNEAEAAADPTRPDVTRDQQEQDAETDTGEPETTVATDAEGEEPKAEAEEVETEQAQPEPEPEPDKPEPHTPEPDTSETPTDEAQTQTDEAQTQADEPAPTVEEPQTQTADPTQPTADDSIDPDTQSQYSDYDGYQRQQDADIAERIDSRDDDRATPDTSATADAARSATVDEPALSDYEQYQQEQDADVARDFAERTSDDGDAGTPAGAREAESAEAVDGAEIHEGGIDQ
jgi:hypothetical protein